MDMSSSVERGDGHSYLYPRHRSSSSCASNVTSYHGTNDTSDNVMGTPTRSFAERIESFVGSISRTSLMNMAENQVHTEDYDSMASVPESMNEHTQLLYPPLGQVYTGSTLEDTDSPKSSFAQSLFNAVNILMGVGILSLPLGFKYAGWILGLCTFIFCLGLTNYTAKLLGRCLHAYPDSQTYGDMAYNAFGNHGRIVVSVLFLTELITCSVALVVLLGDGLDSLFPGHHLFFIRAVSFLILSPMLFIPVRHLSYSSLLGILSALSILAVILVDGCFKTTRPGSLIESAETTWWPEDWMVFPRSTGLIMAGFCGHACLATIYRDMQHPKQYVKMVNWTYFISAIIYLAVAVAGYRMFGSDTMQEISQNLLMVPEYNRMLNRMAVYLIALNPIAKYGLTLNPVNLSWELALSRHFSIQVWLSKHPSWAILVHITGKALVSLFVVLLAFYIPDFDRVMSLLGACFSFLISGVFPILCYLALFRLPLVEKIILYILLFLSFAFAVIGTLWSFI